ncbi:MarR family winged helix-turn-helix transcriptional regulator [Gordonia alkaliphila]
MSDVPAGDDAEELNVGVAMFVAHRWLEDRALAAVHRAGGTDVTPAQARLLQRVDPRGTRLSELAERALVTKQTAATLVTRLVAAGYLERVADPDDGRARLLRLTDRARDLAVAADGAVGAALDEWTAQIGAGRMRELRRTLARLRPLTDPFGSAAGAGSVASAGDSDQGSPAATSVP